MENTTEQLDAQNPQGTGVRTVELTQEELDDLKHKADVSSQNFERAKKAEFALQELKNTTNNEEPANQGLKEEIRLINDRLAKQEVLEANPILKDKWKELEEFRNLPDNKGMSLKTSAKAFLVENGLLEVRRQGLEQKTGGDRQPVNTGMTAEEAEQLRSSNWKLYQQKLMAGEIPSAK